MDSRRIVVSSASGSNGAGRGELLAFSLTGAFLGPFTADPRVADPRGLHRSPDGGLLYVNSGAEHILALNSDGKVILDSGPIPGLNAGGAAFGLDGRYYLGLRGARTVASLPASLDEQPLPFFAPGVVPFVRGFAFGSDGRLFVASGRAPTGQGDDTIAVFGQQRHLISVHLVSDPELSPLDLAVAPDGDVFVSSEYPFGAPHARSTLRRYDAQSGELLQVLEPPPQVRLRRPRGLRFDGDRTLFCVGQDAVIAFDWRAGSFIGVVATLSDLHGQAVAIF